MNKKQSKIKYFDLYGLRKEKYKFLENHDVKNTKWQNLELKDPHFWFVPKDTKGEKTYNKFISVKDIFEKYNAGIATGKDDVLVDFDKQSLIRKLSVLDKNLFEMSMQNYGVEKELADRWYKELKEIEIKDQIKLYNYRPFDNRFTIYNSKILQRARQNIMDNFLKDNLGIILQNFLKGEIFTEVFTAEYINDKHLIGHQSYIFPLYLYELHKKFIFKGQKHLDITGIQKGLDEREQNKKSNIKGEIIKKLSEFYKKKITSEEIFYYIYGVLYSNIYRKKYNEFLKIDFPKIPFTKNAKLFYKIAGLGEELANLHLLKSKRLENVRGVKFPVVGTNKVEKREFQDNITIGAFSPEADKKLKLKSKGTIRINDKQFFAGVPKEAWNYHIGGYQVLDKWLKDRTGRVLSSEDVNHYLKIITALSWTIYFQKQIDEIYSEIEKSLIKK